MKSLEPATSSSRLSSSWKVEGNYMWNVQIFAIATSSFQKEHWEVGLLHPLSLPPPPEKKMKNGLHEHNIDQEHLRLTKLHIHPKGFMAACHLSYNRELALKQEEQNS
jgi:hypothetical protein